MKNVRKRGKLLIEIVWTIYCILVDFSYPILQHYIGQA